MAHDWNDIGNLIRHISKRLRDEQNGLEEEGVFDALVEALGDDGREACILWWCKNLSWGNTYWCLKHGDEWSPVFRAARGGNDGTND